VRREEQRASRVRAWPSRRRSVQARAGAIGAGRAQAPERLAVEPSPERLCQLRAAAGRAPRSGSRAKRADAVRRAPLPPRARAERTRSAFFPPVGIDELVAQEAEWPRSEATPLARAGRNSALQGREARRADFQESCAPSSLLLPARPLFRAGTPAPAPEDRCSYPAGRRRRPAAAPRRPRTGKLSASLRAEPAGAGSVADLQVPEPLPGGRGRRSASARELQPAQFRQNRLRPACPPIPAPEAAAEKPGRRSRSTRRRSVRPAVASARAA